MKKPSVQPFRAFRLPFLWRPAGLVDSLSELPLSDSVLAKHDVSRSVDPTAAGSSPLIVAELAGGKIIGDLRLAVTRDDVVIGGMQTIYAAENPSTHYALHRKRFRLPSYRSGRALLMGTAISENYYSWLIESLSRWKMVQAAGYHEYDHVLLCEHPFRFQEEVLDRLQIPAHKRLRLRKGNVYQFERLIVPDMPYPLRQVVPWTCETARSLFPDRGGGPEKIFISRSATPKRRLLNETALESRLQCLGFTSVKPEKYSVADQAKLFGSARYVVAAHGAGLTNMVFAPAGATLIELLHPVALRPTYTNLSAACNQHYYPIIGKIAPGPHPGNKNETPYSIDIPEVLRIVQENLSPAYAA